MPTLRAIANHPMPTSHVAFWAGILSALGGTAVGLVLLTRTADPSLFYGPAALVIFGWSLLVPDIYSDITVKAYAAILITYVLLYLGLFAVIQAGTPASVVPLYVGLGVLAYGARQTSKAPVAQFQFHALAADTLFVVVLVLIVLLTAYSLSAKNITTGMIGSAAQQISDSFSGRGRISEAARTLMRSFLDNLELEYYTYCVLALFWLTSRRTAPRYIPHRAAGYCIFTVGILLLGYGIVASFRAKSLMTAFLSASVCAAAVGVVYIARNQLHVLSASRDIGGKNATSTTASILDAAAGPTPGVTGATSVSADLPSSKDSRSAPIPPWMSKQ